MEGATDDMKPDLVTIAEAAALAGKRTGTIHSAIRKGRILPAQLGRPGPGNGHLLLRADVEAQWPSGKAVRTRHGKVVTWPTFTCAYCGESFALKPNRSRTLAAQQERHFCCKNHFHRYLRISPGGLTLAEAGRILGCTRQNVSTLLKRGTLINLKMETVLAYHQQKNGGGNVR